MKVCTNCRSNVPDEAFTCPNCGGTNLVYSQQQPMGQPGQMPGQMPGPMPGPMQGPAVEDNCSAGFYVLSFLFPIAGIILFFVWKNTKPQSAKKMLYTGLIAWAVWFVLNMFVL